MTVSIHTFSGSSLNEVVESHVRTLGFGSSFVRGFGFVTDAVVRIGDQEVRVNAGTLVSLIGSAHLDGDSVVFRATVVLSHSVGGVPVLVGGELVEARAEGVECCFTGAKQPAVAPADAPPPAHAKPAPKAKVSAPAQEQTEAPAAKPPPEKLPKRSVAKEFTAPERRSPPKKRAEKPRATSADWARVLAASQDMSASGDDGEIDVDELERGDVLLHPSLDECTILAVISDDAVKVRLPNGSVRKLVMRNFRLFADGDGRFRVEKRAKR